MLECLILSIHAESENLYMSRCPYLSINDSKFVLRNLNYFYPCLTYANYKYCMHSRTVYFISNSITDFERFHKWKLCLAESFCLRGAQIFHVQLSVNCTMKGILIVHPLFNNRQQTTMHYKIVNRTRIEY
jgi:hypothetical protein